MGAQRAGILSLHAVVAVNDAYARDRGAVRRQGHFFTLSHRAVEHEATHPSSPTRPKVEAASTFGGYGDAVGAFCNLGHDAGNGARCRPGAGMAGWRRIVETATELPETSANVANLATDEIDYLRLVFCDRYGLDVLTIPQARSISEMSGDCASEPDFHRRVAALADLLGHLAPWDALPDAERVDKNGVRVGPLVALERLIQRDYPEAVV